jgi:hypothetical protein
MMYDQAIRRLVPNAEYSISGNEIVWENRNGHWSSDNFVWFLKGIPKPTKAELDQALEEVHAEWQSTEYQRLRAPEYPPMTDYLDAVYWQSQGDDSKMTAYLAAVAAVKSKYPKE